MAAAGGAGAGVADAQYDAYVKRFTDTLKFGSHDVHRDTAAIFRYMNGLEADIRSRFRPLTKVEDPALKARIVNYRFPNGTPLLIAYSTKMNRDPHLAEVITLFHEHGADLNATDPNNATILTHVCYMGNARAVARLMEIKRAGAPVNVNIIDRSEGFNTTPLYYAVANESPAIVEQLIAQPDIEPNGFVGPRNTTALYEAAYLGHHDTVRILVANPRVDLLRGAPDGSTAFHAAARYGRRAVIEEFLRLPAERGFDPNHTNIYDETALSLARKHEHPTIVALLEPLVPAPPALPHAPQTYRYNPAAPPQYFDAIMYGDVPVADADDDTIVFNIEGSPGFFGFPKEIIQKHINKEKWTVFECLREQHGSATITVQMVDGIPRMAPVQTDFNPAVKYYNLKNGPFAGIVPMDELRAALRMDTNIFQLRRSARRLAFTTDYKNIIVNGPRGLGFRRKEVDNMSARHCQAGTAEDVWNIHPLVLEADPAMPAPAANAGAGEGAGAAAGSQGGGRRRRHLRYVTHRRRANSRRRVTYFRRK